MESRRTIFGGAEYRLKLKVGATISNAGTITIHDTSNNYGEAIPCTTTSFQDSWGISLDTATYSATQGDDEGIVTVNARSDAIIKAKLSGGATTGTDLTTLSNTSEDTGGTTVTDADVGTADMVSGTLYCLSGGNVGLSRIITTFNSAQDFVVTVPFPRTIAVGDEFLWAPQSRVGDGGGNAQATATDFLEVNGAIASGTGGQVGVLRLLFDTAASSHVEFINTHHALLGTGVAA